MRNLFILYFAVKNIDTGISNTRITFQLFSYALLSLKVKKIIGFIEKLVKSHNSVHKISTSLKGNIEIVNQFVLSKLNL